MIKKFFVVGAISTVVDYSIYSFLIYCSIAYYIAIVIGYMIGFLANFVLVRKMVFVQGSRFEKVYHEFFAVFTVSVIAVGLNIFIVWFLAIFGINYYIGRVIALVLVFFFNYYARKGFIYVA